MTFSPRDAVPPREPGRPRPATDLPAADAPERRDAWTDPWKALGSGFSMGLFFNLVVTWADRHFPGPWWKVAALLLTWLLGSVAADAVAAWAARRSPVRTRTARNIVIPVLLTVAGSGLGLLLGWAVVSVLGLGPAHVPGR